MRPEKSDCSRLAVVKVGGTGERKVPGRRLSTALRPGRS